MILYKNLYDNNFIKKNIFGIYYIFNKGGGGGKPKVGKHKEKVYIKEHQRVTKSGKVTSVEAHFKEMFVGSDKEMYSTSKVYTLTLLSKTLKGKVAEKLVEICLGRHKESFSKVEPTKKNFEKQDVVLTTNDNKKILVSVKATGLVGTGGKKFMGKHTITEDQINKFDKVLKSNDVNDYVDFVNSLFYLEGMQPDALSLLTTEGGLLGSVWGEVKFMDGFINKENIKSITRQKNGIIVEHKDGRKLKIVGNGKSGFDVLELDQKDKPLYKISFDNKGWHISVIDDKIINFNSEATKHLNNDYSMSPDEVRSLIDGYFEYKTGGKNMAAKDKVFIMAISMSADNLIGISKNRREIETNIRILGKDVYGLADDEIDGIVKKLNELSDEIDKNIKNLNDDLDTQLYGVESVSASKIEPLKSFSLDNIESLESFYPYVECLRVFKGLASNIFSNMILKDAFETVNPNSKYSAAELHATIDKHIRENNMKGLKEKLSKEYNVQLDDDILFDTFVNTVRGLHKNGALTEENIGNLVRCAKNILVSKVATEQGLSEGGFLFERAFSSLYKTAEEITGLQTGVFVLPTLSVIDGFVDVGVFNYFKDNAKNIIGEKAVNSLHKALFGDYNIGASGFLTFQLKSSSRGIGYFNVKEETIIDTLNNDSPYQKIAKRQFDKVVETLSKVLDDKGNIDIEKIKNLPDEEKAYLIKNLFGVVYSNIISKVCHGDQYYGSLGTSSLHRKGHVNIIKDKSGKHEIISSNHADISYVDPNSVNSVLENFATIYNANSGSHIERTTKTLNDIRDGVVYGKKSKSNRINKACRRLKRNVKPRIISKNKEIFSINIKDTTVTVQRVQ